MCLDEITERYSRCKRICGYVVRRKIGREIASPYMLTGYKLKKWYRAVNMRADDNSTLRTQTGNRSYIPGFHVFKNKEDAELYKQDLYCPDTVIVKVSGYTNLEGKQLVFGQVTTHVSKSHLADVYVCQSIYHHEILNETEKI